MAAERMNSTVMDRVGIRDRRVVGGRWEQFLSNEAMGYVFRHSPYTGAAFQVHLAIADSVNDQHDNELFMLMSTLATKARTTRATAQKVVGQMIEDGFLSRLTSGQKRGIHSRYRFIHRQSEVVYETRGGVSREHTQVSAQDTPPVSREHTGCVDTTHRTQREPKENPKNETLSHAASLPAPDWTGFERDRDDVEHFASISPPSFADRLRSQLLDPAFWMQVDGVTAGTKVFYDESFREYVTWNLSRPASRQHKNVRKGFLAWVREDIRRSARKLRAV